METINVEPNYDNLRNTFTQEVKHSITALSQKKKHSRKDVYRLVHSINMVLVTCNSVKAFTDFRDEFEKLSSQMFEATQSDRG